MLGMKICIFTDPVLLFSVLAEQSVFMVVNAFAHPLSNMLLEDS